MRRIILSVLIPVLWSSPVDAAKCRVVRSRVVCSKPVAVVRKKAAVVKHPVAAKVPIATVAPYFYAYLGAHASPPAEEPAFGEFSDREIGQLAAEIARRLGNIQELGASLVTTTCGRCHSGQTPKGGFAIPRPLDAQTSLKMISRIIHPDPDKRMPPDTDLTPEEVGELLQELTISSE